GHAAALEALLERLAVEVLHDHEAVAVRCGAAVEHLDDVVRADAAGRLGLALEAPGVLGVALLLVEHLHRDRALDAHVLADVHGAHPPAAEHAAQAVLAVEGLAFAQHR